MTHIRRLTGGVAVGTAILLVAAGCAAPGSTPDPAAGGDDDLFQVTTTTPDPVGELDLVTYRIFNEPLSLDFVRVYAGPENLVAANVCESLIRMNPDFTISPGLAESWESSDGGKVWIYQLRQGVKFHDGTEMTAEDAVFSLKRHMDPALGSAWAGFFMDVEDITATGPYEVTVELAAPSQLFNPSLATQAGTVDSKATIEALGAEYGTPTGLVNCTGPFVATEWAAGQHVMLERFDDYWGELPLVKQLKMVPIIDDNTTINSLLAGELDGAASVPSTALKTLNDSGLGRGMYARDNTHIQFILTNLDGVFGDVKVRQALSYALDREGIIEAAAGGAGTVAASNIPASIWSEAPADFVEDLYEGVNHGMDLEKANDLIAQTDAVGKEFVIAIPSGHKPSEIAAQAVAEAGTALGMKPRIEVEATNYAAFFFDPQARKRVDMFWTNWNMEAPTPLDTLVRFTTGHPSNYGGYSNAEYDKLVDAALVEADTQKRVELMADALRIANEEVPWLSMYATNGLTWWNNRVTGMEPSVAYLYYPWAASIGAAG